MLVFKVKKCLTVDIHDLFHYSFMLSRTISFIFAPQSSDVL